MWQEAWWVGYMAHKGKWNTTVFLRRYRVRRWW
jgi:hypothetical protein